MTAFCILAIDPGVCGATCFYFTAANRVCVEDMPAAAGQVDAATLAERIRQMRPDIAIIEHVGAMPKQGVSSTFKFGRAFGTIIGVVAALGIPTYFVAPTKWKKHFGLSADKEEARARALQLWPARAELFARKKDHNRAEAALIARFAAETFPEFRVLNERTESADGIVGRKARLSTESLCTKDHER